MQQKLNIQNNISVSISLIQDQDKLSIMSLIRISTVNKFLKIINYPLKLE